MKILEIRANQMSINEAFRYMSKPRKKVLLEASKHESLKFLHVGVRYVLVAKSGRRFVGTLVENKLGFEGEDHEGTPCHVLADSFVTKGWRICSRN